MVAWPHPPVRRQGLDGRAIGGLPYWSLRPEAVDLRPFEQPDRSVFVRAVPSPARSRPRPTASRPRVSRRLERRIFLRKIEVPQKTVATLCLEGRVELGVVGDLSLPLALRRDGAEQVVERLLDIPGREGRRGARMGEPVEVKPLVVADESVREVGPPWPLVEPPAAVGMDPAAGNPVLDGVVGLRSDEEALLSARGSRPRPRRAGRSSRPSRGT